MSKKVIPDQEMIEVVKEVKPIVIVSFNNASYRIVEWKPFYKEFNGSINTHVPQILKLKYVDLATICQHFSVSLDIINNSIEVLRKELLEKAIVITTNDNDFSLLYDMIFNVSKELFLPVKFNNQDDILGLYVSTIKRYIPNTNTYVAFNTLSEDDELFVNSIEIETKFRLSSVEIQSNKPIGQINLFNNKYNVIAPRVGITNTTISNKREKVLFTYSCISNSITIYNTQIDAQHLVNKFYNVNGIVNSSMLIDFKISDLDININYGSLYNSELTGLTYENSHKLTYDPVNKSRIRLPVIQNGKYPFNIVNSIVIVKYLNLDTEQENGEYYTRDGEFIGYISIIINDNLDIHRCNEVVLLCMLPDTGSVCEVNKRIDIDGMNLNGHYHIIAKNSGYVFEDSIFKSKVILLDTSGKEVVAEVDNIRLNCTPLGKPCYTKLVSFYKGVPLEKYISKGKVLSLTDKFNNDVINTYLKFINNIEKTYEPFI